LRDTAAAGRQPPDARETGPAGSGPRADGRATADQVIAVAERLFAERGVEAVSLREVGKAAASRNTAVAHYHFGGKEGLIRAIVARRAPVLNGRRAELLDQARDRAAALGRAVPPEELVRALVVPLIEELDRDGHYVGFLARLAAERHRAPWVAELDDSSTASFREVCRLLTQELPGLDRRRFRHRRDLLVQLVVGSLAARQNAETSGQRGLGARADFTEDLLEAAVGLMLAPLGPDGRDPRRPDRPEPGSAGDGRA
jgi:AcrR family transcriptional regulator